MHILLNNYMHNVAQPHVKESAPHAGDRKLSKRLLEAGQIERLDRGFYVAAGKAVSPFYGFAAVARRSRTGVICLTSALVFHELTDQVPVEIYVALPMGARVPQPESVGVRSVRMSAETLAAGVEVHEIEGVMVRIFNPAKTVADCFKFRNKIGLDVALEALRNCWRGKHATMDELWHYAEICRVANVMRPYLESLV